MDDFIPIYVPHVAKNQKAYVLDCLGTNWISSKGKWIEKFEGMVAEKVGKGYESVSVCNGTVALMLTYASMGLRPGDEVVVPSLTYCATISQLNWLGVTPVLVDSDDNYQIDVTQLPKTLSRKTKAVVVPELYGDLPDMDVILDFCAANELLLIEDSAETFGCAGAGKWGNAATFSFFANKTITTGEGGCVVTDNKELAKTMRLLRSQAHIGNFVHKGPGFNFRMTNLQAAIGVAQLEEFDVIVSRKQQIATYYRNKLSDSVGKIRPSVASAEWMPLFTLPETMEYVKFMNEMHKRKIDTRACFTPIHLMEGFDYTRRTALDNCERIYRRGFNLPSYPGLTDEQLKYICDNVNEVVEIVG